MADPISIPPAAEARTFARSGNVMLGIGMKVASVLVFIVMSSLLKATEDVPSGELVFFRSFFALVPIVVFLAWNGQLTTGWKTKFLFGHIWRGAVGVTSMAMSFYALTKLPLPEAVAINYATPLWVVILSALVWKENVRFYRWGAVVVGLIGVLTIMWPRLTLFSGGGVGLDETIGALAALVATVFAALAVMLVRKLVHTESSSTIVLYFSISSSLFALLSLPFGWIWPTPQQWLFLVGAGIAGGIAQVLLTECYRHADLSVVAPFEYSSLILSLIIGYLAFGDVPTVQMLIGGVIVVASGIFIILREHRLGLERRKSRQVSPP